VSKADRLRFLTAKVGHDRYTVPIYEAAAGNRCVTLFRTLMSSFCENNCRFCSFRRDRGQRRERWEPHELARVAMQVWREGQISGLFLSSCVERDPDTTVGREIEAVDALRGMGFTGYDFLKAYNPLTDAT